MQVTQPMPGEDVVDMPMELVFPVTVELPPDAEVDDRLAMAAGVIARRLPRSRFEVTSHSIVIAARAPREFNIGLMHCGQVWILTFDDWHEEFQDLDSAVQLIMLALSGRVRLRIDRVAGRPNRWTVERMTESGRWNTIYSSGFVMFSWGRTTDSIYRLIDETV